MGMGEIIFNPAGLGDLSDVYDTEFDAKLVANDGEMRTAINELKGTWGGEEAELANVSFDKILGSLEELEERSKAYGNIVKSKAEGFQAVTQETANKLRF